MQFKDFLDSSFYAMLLNHIIAQYICLLLLLFYMYNCISLKYELIYEFYSANNCKKYLVENPINYLLF